MMKFVALMVSLLFGFAVLLLFLRPWEYMKQAAAPAPAAMAERVEAMPPPPQPATASPPPPPAAATPPPAPAAATPVAPPKQVLLPNERAEADRLAALDGNTPRAVTQKPETKRYFKVKVRDAGTLEVDGPGSAPVRITLEGIEARGADENCTRGDGTAWPCGAKAKSALTLFIRSRAVTCTLPQGGEQQAFTSRCSVANQDLATWLVRRGWAVPAADAGKPLAAARDEAKAEKAGVWDRE
jgi:endonuclease YncB( thermonuclease family)